MTPAIAWEIVSNADARHSKRTNRPPLAPSRLFVIAALMQRAGTRRGPMAAVDTAYAAFCHYLTH